MYPFLSYRNRQHCSTKDSYPRLELGCRKRIDSRPVHRQHRALYRVAVRQEDMRWPEEAVGVRTSRFVALHLLILHQDREYRLHYRIERKSAQHLTVKQVRSFQE